MRWHEINAVYYFITRHEINAGIILRHEINACIILLRHEINAVYYFITRD